MVVAQARCRAGEAILSLDGNGGLGPLLSASGLVLPNDGSASADAGPDRTPDGDGSSQSSPGDVEIGDAVVEDDGYAVSLVHRTAAGRTCAVAHLGRAGRGPVQLVDLGPTLGDAPPARLVRVKSELLAAAYGVRRSGKGAGSDRELVVYSLADAGSTSRAVLGQQRDDSLAFDVASSGRATVVVWDEAAAGPRGVIRAAALPSNDSDGFGPVRDVSPPDADAETPRLVFTASRFVAFWLARRPESASDAAPEQNPMEALGEARTYGWIESADLDESGATVAARASRALTPQTGHVSAYDVAVLDDSSILVVARDDGEVVEGSGGRLLRVRVSSAGVDPPLAFAADGLGRGAPVLVDGPPRWLSWVGPREQLRLLPLDEIGAPAGPSSAEDAMSDGRPLLTTRSSSEGAPLRLFVAFPSRAEGQVRTFTCFR
jgi:hypothetical protein